MSWLVDAAKNAANKAEAALQKLELPFFATSATWVDRPFGGVRVRGNLREAQTLKIHIRRIKMQMYKE